MEENSEKIELIASKRFSADSALVHVVNFLNKTLKHKKIMFGLVKDKENNEMIINIYEF
ncbi:MAG: YpmA family protein [Syntrophomonadaceae bacterium]|nr:YpmA family protein [Syntrophomonadaceae bacterium]